MKQFRFLLFFCCLILFLTSCNKIGVFEKNVSIPKMEWNNNFKPVFEFAINDTTSEYTVYVVLRHTDAYHYNNIWLEVGSQSPTDSMRYQRLELQLGSDAQGWEGTGMDDIWEVRKPITNGPIRFKKAGNYKFLVAQIMRENPLNYVMNAGIRVEKNK